ncbi:5-oxoprolinase subunit PxpA [Flammeovirga yaeyamensis]|uniref:5-oxoprolinase subunit PxpA n=1 Tax=Flammeovirga yaeyamensis TaxID=367791 RepID=A0AAX1N8K2_9BACT|nr:5-oxoprolinase subunit PxpA [Flammeovirga yaeyamensis]MBB3699841.1 UPF0271 protein [Flammeovirga yaeyamensis]NMF36590.1 5-oxoprolinase subunit PxpA [Flammeovirga yaeyamensis]QWG02362.1 5-oxoprolinase subunit PxpA [Flammeovirga yaeyamensis]
MKWFFIYFAQITTITLLKKIDLNADLGEGFPYDEQLLRYVSSCNIACGGHSGDTQSMRSTLLLAQKNNVNIGAHPSYPNRENFGRKVMDIDAKTLLSSLIKQCEDLIKIATELNVKVNYIKPHGALYNKAMNDSSTAQIIIKLIENYNGQFALMGMPNSILETLCKEKNITFIREGFADRRYTANGKLVARSENHAVIHDKEDVWQQVEEIVKNKRVIDENDEFISMPVDSICFHGDTPEALEELQFVFQKLSEENIQIQSIL